jgi:nicotinamidase-related amidase
MPTKYTELLTPANCQIAFIDHQPQMTFGVANIERQSLINNVVLVAKAAKSFQLPVTLTAVETESFSGYLWPQLLNVFPGHEVVERSSMNSWDDARFVASVKAAKRPKLVLAALWTEVCLCMPALEALADGFEVYFITDASGGTSKEAHDMTVQRLIQAGAAPITSLQFLLELQRDWARKETYNEVTGMVKEHCGAYGVGIEYAATMVHHYPQSAIKPHVVVAKAHP